MCSEETVLILLNGHRNTHPVVRSIYFYFSFSSLIMFAASQAFQKTAGEFILYPNTLQYFGGSLSLAGHEKMVANPPWLH